MAFYCNIAYSQDSIQKSLNEYSYYEGDKCYRIIELCVKNIADDPCVIWISKSNKINKTEETLIKEFFMERKPDFSFMEFIYEDLYEKAPVALGYTFIKTLKNNEEFSFIFLIQGKCDKTDIQKFYDENIVIMNKKQLDRFKFPEGIYYLYNYVVLYR